MIYCIGNNMIIHFRLYQRIYHFPLFYKCSSLLLIFSFSSPPSFSSFSSSPIFLLLLLSLLLPIPPPLPLPPPLPHTPITFFTCFLPSNFRSSSRQGHDFITNKYFRIYRLPFGLTCEGARSAIYWPSAPCKFPFSI